MQPGNEKRVTVEEEFTRYSSEGMEKASRRIEITEEPAEQRTLRIGFETARFKLRLGFGGRFVRVATIGGFLITVWTVIQIGEWLGKNFWGLGP